MEIPISLSWELHTRAGYTSAPLEEQPGTQEVLPRAQLGNPAPSPAQPQWSIQMVQSSALKKFTVSLMRQDLNVVEHFIRPQLFFMLKWRCACQGCSRDRKFSEAWSNWEMCLRGRDIENWAWNDGLYLDFWIFKAHLWFVDFFPTQQKETETEWH